MELILLVVLAVAAYVIFFPLYLGGRISELERRLRQLEGGEASAPTRSQQVPQQTPYTGQPGAVPPPPPVPGTMPSPAPTYAPQSAMAAPAEPNAFIEWLKQDFFVKLGAFLLLLALGWFVSYAFANNWIGPAGRIFLGLGAGVCFLLLGVWRITTQLHQGSIFTVLGATTVLLTVFAARELYGFFTPLTALMVMFAAVVFVAFVSLRYETERLAIAGLILGSIAPLFTNAPAPDAAGLFTYLMVVVLGTLWIVAQTGWKHLAPLAIVILFFYSLPFLFGGMSEAETTISLLFAFAFTGIFFIANVISLVFRGDGSYRQAHLFTAAGTAVFLLLWVYAAASPEWQSLLFAGWALVFAVGSYVVYTMSQNHAAFYLYGGTAVALIGSATAAELSGPVLTIAFALEIGVLLIAAGALRASALLLSRLALLFIVPMLLSLESIVSSSWEYRGIMHSDFVVVLMMALVLGVSALYLNTRSHEDTEGGVATIANTLAVISGAYLVALVWLSLHAMLVDDMATMLALIVYTISGLALFISGKAAGEQALKLSGAVLIGLVILRLLFVEVWDMDLVGRIITFFVIGALLVSTAFIRGPRQTDSTRENA